MRIIQIIDKYRENYYTLKKAEELLKECNNYEDWSLAIQKRADIIQEIFIDNNAILDELNEYYKNEIKDSNEAYKIFDKINELYFEYIDETKAAHSFIYL